MRDAKVELITNIIEKPLNDLGFDLARVSLSGKVKLKLQVMIDRMDETPITMKDCVKASRYISSLMDVEDPIDASYDLEVSSPGHDRPLTRPKDFRRYVNNKIKLKTFDPIDGQKRFQGLLKEVGDDGIILMDESSEKPVEIRFEGIQIARLIPSYEKLDKGQKQKREP